MTHDERVKMYTDYLAEEGYMPHLDKDGDVVFKHEGHTYIILVAQTDEEFFRLVLPNFWSIDDEPERAKVYRASAVATERTKVAKVFPVRDNTWATVEMFVDPPTGFKPVFRRSISAIMSGVKTFLEEMKS